MRIVIVFAFILALAVPVQANPGLWDDVAHAVFRLYLFPDARAGMCTAWATAPAAEDREGQQRTYYVTAGHCRPVQYVSDAGLFLHLPLLASSDTIRLDVGIGIRPDHRDHRTFLPLDPTPARPGDRVLGIGFPNGMLAASVMTVTGSGPEGLIVLASSMPLAGGWSGAPLVSLTTGRVIGVLADGVRGHPSIAVAVPAARISALLALTEPQALGLPMTPRPTGRILSR